MKLCDAIDQDKFIIDNKTFTDDDLQAMNIDNLETLKMQITKKINGLSVSIKERQIEYARGGRSAPTEWYMNRKLALSINQRVMTYVNYLIKKDIGQNEVLAITLWIPQKTFCRKMILNAF